MTGYARRVWGAGGALFLFVACGAVAGWHAARAEEPLQPAQAAKPEKKEKPRAETLAEPGVRTFMRGKLEHSQKLLEAVVLNDFDSVAKHGKQLAALSQAAEWQVLRTEEYAAQSREFRRAADDLAAAAEKENSDAMALAYVDLTLRCVKCHTHVRKVRMAAASPGARLRLADYAPAAKPAR